MLKQSQCHETPDMHNLWKWEWSNFCTAMAALLPKLTPLECTGQQRVGCVQWLGDGCWRSWSRNLWMDRAPLTLSQQCKEQVCWYGSAPSTSPSKTWLTIMFQIVDPNLQNPFLASKLFCVTNPKLRSLQKCTRQYKHNLCYICY